MGEMLETFILFKGRISIFKQNIGRCPLNREISGDLTIFENIQRESGRVSQNREKKKNNKKKKKHASILQLLQAQQSLVQSCAIIS